LLQLSRWNLLSRGCKHLLQLPRGYLPGLGGTVKLQQLPCGLLSGHHGRNCKHSVQQLRHWTVLGCRCKRLQCVQLRYLPGECGAIKLLGMSRRPVPGDHGCHRLDELLKLRCGHLRVCNGLHKLHELWHGHLHGLCRSFCMHKLPRGNVFSLDWSDVGDDLFQLPRRDLLGRGRRHMRELRFRLLSSFNRARKLFELCGGYIFNYCW